MIIDLFAGAGGWDVAARSLGFSTIGLEINRDACRTRAAAGLLTVRTDVATFPFEHLVGRVEGLIASPPCQSFSRAGKRAGLKDARGQLVFQVMRWAEALRPRWIACEQVPDVLPIWRMFAEELRALGYSAWAGCVQTEQWGVPQTRRRAILIARRDGVTATAPEPTHQRYDKGVPRGAVPGSMFTLPLLPWVSMADALGWGMTTVRTRGERSSGGGNIFEAQRPSWAVTSKARSWQLHTNRDQRADGSRQVVSVDQPAPTVTAQSGGQWKLRAGPTSHATSRAVDEPAPTILAAADNGGTAWFFDRPATTVCADARLAGPGYRGCRSDYVGGRKPPSRQDAEGTVSITVAEAATLQGFPPDHPWQGSRTEQFRQVGNAIPPPLAAAILAPLVGTVGGESVMSVAS